jgi:hypothetical protein
MEGSYAMKHKTKPFDFMNQFVGEYEMIEEMRTIDPNVGCHKQTKQCRSTDDTE